MKRLLLVCTTFVTASGCSLPLIGGGSYAAFDADAEQQPVVQVREFHRSSVVSVVAWDLDDAAVGLRSAVTRTGQLVGGLRFGDHRLYMTPLYARDMGGFKYAAVDFGELLVGAGAERDAYSCYYGKHCSPMVTVGVGIPDSLLRANRDDLIVTFFPAVRQPWTMTIRRELIAAYLQKVDSVAAAMRQNASTSRARRAIE